MHIDPKRLARQEQAFGKWRANGAKGCIKAVTGFGKTFIAIMACKYMNEKHPDWNAIVIIPNLNLKQDWEDPLKGHTKEHKLFNVKPFVINTYVKYESWKCDLLIVDEVHRILNEDATQFSKALKVTNFKYILCMTATLTDKQEEFLERQGIKVVDSIDEIEAQNSGFISPAVTYNLGIKLSPEDQIFNEEINEKFRRYFAKFDHEFDLLKACNAGENVTCSVRTRAGAYLGRKTGKQWREYHAKNNGWKEGNETHPYSPLNISKNAAQCMYTIAQRKNKWQNFPSKIEVAVEVVKKFKDLKTIIFSETSKFADKLHELIPNSLSYHSAMQPIAVKGTERFVVTDSFDKDHLKEQGYTIIGKAKQKTEAKLKFSDPKSGITVMCAVRSLDEGADFPHIGMLLFTAYSSVQRQRIQREGRGRRIEFNNLDKKTLMVYLYMKDTQEEKWLRESQKGKREVRWIDSVDEIKLDPTAIKLSATPNGPVTITPDQIRVVSSNSNLQSS